MSILNCGQTVCPATRATVDINMQQEGPCSGPALQLIQTWSVVNVLLQELSGQACNAAGESFPRASWQPLSTQPSSMLSCEDCAAVKHLCRHLPRGQGRLKVHNP